MLTGKEDDDHSMEFEKKKCRKFVVWEKIVEILLNITL